MPAPTPLKAGEKAPAFTFNENGKTIRSEELTSPYQATAKLCGMVWLPPFIIFGVHSGLTDEELQSYAENYQRSVITLRDKAFDSEK